jgi:hypothetical protein
MPDDRDAPVGWNLQPLPVIFVLDVVTVVTLSAAVSAGSRTIQRAAPSSRDAICLLLATPVRVFGFMMSTDSAGGGQLDRTLPVLDLANHPDAPAARWVLVVWAVRWMEVEDSADCPCRRRVRLPRRRAAERVRCCTCRCLHVTWRGRGSWRVITLASRHRHPNAGVMAAPAEAEVSNGGG